MSDQQGPWAPRSAPPEPTPPPRTSFRLGLWLAVVIAAGAGVWALSRLFPGAAASTEDWSNVAYGLGMTAVVSALLLRMPRVTLGRSARYVAIWAGLLAVLVVGYSYRNELGALTTRVRAAFAPGVAVASGPREMVVSQDDQGQFLVIGQVDGQTVRFVVDTGASDIVLSPADARRLGIDVDHLTFPKVVETANGPGRAAPYTARSLDIGDLQLADVEMSIDSAPMSTSLLGMSFLRRLESFQVKDGRLVLRW